MIVGMVMLSLDNYQAEAAEATEAQHMNRMEDETGTKAAAEEMIKMNENGDGGKK